MPHDDAWGAAFNAAPADTDQANTLGAIDRETRTNIKQRMDVGFEWEDINDGGKMERLLALRQSADPATPSGTDGALYFKQLGTGRSTLHVKDHTGSVYNLGSRPVFNVMYYGAVGDGVADDSTAIEAAVTAAVTAGGTVYFPAGTYILNASISLNSNIILQGNGAGVSVLKLKNSTNADMLTAAPSRQDIGIFDLELDGNRANQTTGGDGVSLSQGCSQIRVERCFIHDTWDDGIFVNAAAIACTKIQIRGCSFQDNGGHGVNIVDTANGSTGLILSDLEFNGISRTASTTGKRAIKVAGECEISNIQIRNLNETGKTSGGIELVQSAAGPAQDGRQSTVSGVRITGTGSDVVGILCMGRQNVIGPALIRLTGASSVGVRLDGASGALTAFDNLVVGVQVLNASVGFDLTADAFTNRVMNCVAIDCTTGIAVAASATNNAFSAIAFDNCTTPISDNGTGTRYHALSGHPLFTIASAASITVPNWADAVSITGGVTVTTLTTTAWPGRRILFISPDNLSFVPTGFVKKNVGSLVQEHTLSVTRQQVYISDGTSWYEVAVNVG